MKKWKKVNNYDVDVTKDGRTRNSYTKDTKVQYDDKNGYKFISVKYKNKKWTTRKVHTLVALAYVSGFKHGLQINYKDLNKQNNYYKNLEWVTPKQNTNHAVYHGHIGGGKVKYGEDIVTAKLTWKIVKKIRKYIKISKYTQLELARKYGVHNSVICNIVNNKAWKEENEY